MIAKIHIVTCFSAGNFLYFFDKAFITCGRESPVCLLEYDCRFSMK